MELSTIFTTDKVIKIGGRAIIIKQVQLGDIPVVLSFVGKIFEDKKTSLNEKITKLMRDDMESVNKVFGILTDLKEDEIPKLNMAAAITIFVEIVQENADFLHQHVGPEIERLTASLKIKSPVGSTKSKS